MNKPKQWDSQEAKQQTERSAFIQSCRWINYFIAGGRAGRRAGWLAGGRAGWLAGWLAQHHLHHQLRRSISCQAEVVPT